MPSLSQPIMSSSIRQKQGTTSSAMNDEVSTPKASEIAIGVNIIVEIDSLINNGIKPTKVVAEVSTSGLNRDIAALTRAL